MSAPAGSGETRPRDACITDAQWLALYALLDGRGVVEAAAAAHVHRDTVRSWRDRDKVFANILSELRAELHNATLEALKRGAQEATEATRLAIAALLEIITARDMGTGKPIATDYDRAQAARSLAPLVKILLSHGGYPQTERVEGAVEVVTGPRVVEALGRDGVIDLAAAIRARKAAS